MHFLNTVSLGPLTAAASSMMVRTFSVLDFEGAAARTTADDRTEKIKIP